MLVITSLLFLWCAPGCGGCGGGTDSETSTESEGDLPGAPTATVPEGTTVGTNIVTSDNFTVLVRTGATSFKGASGGSGTRISDPFFEAGIDEAVRRGTSDR